MVLLFVIVVAVMGHRTVRPIFKKMNKNKKLSPGKSFKILVLKLCERFLYENLTNFIDTFLSKFIFAYCKFLSFKSRIDSFNGKLKRNVGAVIMGLSKVFDSMPHDLLIAKICVYGFSIDAVTLFYLYLKKRKQNVRVIYTRSIFTILLSGVPKVQYFGHFYSTTHLINFADDNIIRAAVKIL